MSPTSYQAAPPRVIDITRLAALLQLTVLLSLLCRSLVVAGHKNMKNDDDGPRVLEQTRQDILDFQELAEKTTTAKDLYDQMLARYPGWLKASHSPAAWKWLFRMMAGHAAMAAPMQAAQEISLGMLLVIGLFTRPAAFVAFLFLGSLWISEWARRGFGNY